jgi:hypothetical protein
MPSRSASQYASSSRLTAHQEAYLREREAQLTEHAHATTMSGTHGGLSRAASTSRSRTHETTRPRRDTSYSSGTVIPPTSRSHASGRRTNVAGGLGQDWTPPQPTRRMSTMAEQTSSGNSRALVPYGGAAESGLQRSRTVNSSRTVTPGTAVRECSSRAGELQLDRVPTSLSRHDGPVQLSRVPSQSQRGSHNMVGIERTRPDGSRTTIAIANQYGGSGGGHRSISISIHIRSS